MELTPCLDNPRAKEVETVPKVPLSLVLTRTQCLTRTSTSWTCLRWEAPARARKEKAAEKKEFGAPCLDDTTRDNVSSTNANSPVGYIEDAQIRTEDKCR